MSATPRRSGAPRASTLALLAAVGGGALLPATDAHASALDVYGFDPRALAMGGAETSTVDDYTATFYNPAALTRRERVTFGFSYAHYLPALEFGRAKLSSTIAADEPESSGGFGLGVLFPLGGKVKNRVALGVGLYVPSSKLLRLDAKDPVTPQFYMYESSPERLAVLPAIGVRVTDWLSVGAGLQILAELHGRAKFGLDLVNRTVPQKSLEVNIDPAAAPVVGVRVETTPGALELGRLAFGFTWRGPLDLDYALPIDVQLTGLELDAALQVRGVALYSPHHFVFGASWALTALPLLVSLDLDYALWSNAPDPTVDLVADLGGDLLGSLGLDQGLDVPQPGRARNVELGFEDTLTVRVGGEWTPLDWLAVRGGYFLRPSPAPLPTSAGSNYNDGLVNGLSAGAGVRFRDPLEVFEQPIGIDAAVQLLVMPRRSVLKDDPGDLVGDYTAGGHVLTAAFGVRYEY